MLRMIEFLTFASICTLKACCVQTNRVVLVSNQIEIVSDLSCMSGNSSNSLIFVGLVNIIRRVLQMHDYIKQHSCASMTPPITHFQLDSTGCQLLVCEAEATQRLDDQRSQIQNCKK